MTFATIADRLAVAQTVADVNAIGRDLARQLAAAGDDDGLFRLTVLLEHRREALASRN